MGHTCLGQREGVGSLLVQAWVPQGDITGLCLNSYIQIAPVLRPKFL